MGFSSQILKISRIFSPTLWQFVSMGARLNSRHNSQLYPAM
ncbi:hypothetical protein GFS31_26880 [Leptolyngbya sp. BL0902]|nr:hypothetical protein GFS31_26880 [Leptolyngbya sp. BL0902]